MHTHIPYAHTYAPTWTRKMTCSWHTWDSYETRVNCTSRAANAKGQLSTSLHPDPLQKKMVYVYVCVSAISVVAILSRKWNSWLKHRFYVCTRLCGCTHVCVCERKKICVCLRIYVCVCVRCSKLQQKLQQPHEQCSHYESIVSMCVITWFNAWMYVRVSKSVNWCVWVSVCERELCDVSSSSLLKPMYINEISNLCIVCIGYMFWMFCMFCMYIYTIHICIVNTQYIYAYIYICIYIYMHIYTYKSIYVYT